MSMKWLIILIGAGLASPPSTPPRCSRPTCNHDTSCLECSFPKDCRLGEDVKVNCSTVAGCPATESTTRNAQCLYCWQLQPSEYSCAVRTNCSTISTEMIVTECEAHSDVICKGNRKFSKKVRCNWTSGTSWAKTMILSVTLGGFGVDRFYLGLWKSAIGKLFSFGGLGIWTVVDAILIGAGYIRPADGSMYI